MYIADPVLNLPPPTNEQAPEAMFEQPPPSIDASPDAMLL